MSTTTKVSYKEQSKGVIAEVVVESDELSGEEVEAKTRELFEKAFRYSQSKSLTKQ